LIPKPVKIVAMVPAAMGRYGCADRDMFVRRLREVLWSGVSI
jgi:hypothetical protein